MTVGDDFVDVAKVISRGRITIPRRTRAVLGVDAGDQVTFIVENRNVRMVKSAIYALQRFQEQMKGDAVGAGFHAEEDVADWIANSRRKAAE